MATRASRREAAQAARIAELVQKYSGIGKTFRVKYVGSEDIQEKQDDKKAAAAIKRMKEKQAQTKGHKPKVILGMNVKGVTLLEESSQVRTTVVITNVCYIRLDVDDMKYFGMIIKTKESQTKYRLYVFKTDKSTATDFVTSAQELLFLVTKMLEEKKKQKKEMMNPQKSLSLDIEREKLLASASAATEGDGNISTAKPSATETSAPTKPDISEPPSEQSEEVDSQIQRKLPVSERRKKAQTELLQLETELNELFQDIMAGKEAKGNFEDVLSKQVV